MALETTMATLDSRVQQIDGRLAQVTSTALVGRSTEGALTHLANLVAEAVNSIPGSDYEKVRMAKDGLGTSASSRLIKGLVIEKRLALDRLPRNLSDINVAVLTCPIELEKSSRDAEIEITSTTQLEAFIDSEDALVKAKADAIISSGAKAVFSAESIDTRALHFLADAGIFAMGGMERPAVEDIAETTGAELIDHLDDLSESSMGHIVNLEHQRLEGAEGVRERLIIEAGESAGIVTILVGGTDGVVVEETIRGLFDALRSACLAKESDSIILGGGSLHMAASLAVREAAEQCAGRERLSMEAFSRALESIPAALAGNTGADRIDTLLELRSLQRGGNNKAGINRSGKPETIVGAWLPAYTLEHSITAATESACGLLRVDQVISARGD
jgi:T-complex protein 1 subunit epsilon